MNRHFKRAIIVTTNKYGKKQGLFMALALTAVYATILFVTGKKA